MTSASAEMCAFAVAGVEVEPESEAEEEGEGEEVEVEKVVEAVKLVACVMASTRNATSLPLVAESELWLPQAPSSSSQARRAHCWQPVPVLLRHCVAEAEEGHLA